MKQTIYFCLYLFFAIHVHGQSTIQIPPGTTVRVTGGVYLVLGDFNFINNGTFQQASGDGNIKFIGSADNTLSGTGTTTINQLLLAKTTGSKVNLLSGIAVVSGIDFGGGNLNLGSSIVDMGATAQLTNESETNYAYSLSTGYIQSTVNLNAPSSANPGTLGAIITSAANLGNTVIRRSFLSATNSAGNGSSILRKYDITPTNNSSLNATFRFKYLDAELNGLVENSLIFWKSPDNDFWSPQGFTSRNTTANYVELTGINDFSSWTLSSPLNALPVTFGNIKVFEKGSDIIVEWDILTELNTRIYNIQRSADGNTFSNIGNVAAANLSRYNFADHQPPPGNSYYQVQAIDLDNSSKLSRVVRINTTRGKGGIEVFPNPVTGKMLILQFGNAEKGIYQLDLFNANGQKIYAASINHTGGASTETLQLPATITRGSYQLRIKSKTNVFHHSLILQ